MLWSYARGFGWLKLAARHEDAAATARAVLKGSQSGERDHMCAQLGRLRGVSDI